MLLLWAGFAFQSNNAYSKGRRSADPKEDRLGFPRIAPANLGLAAEIETIPHSKLELLATQFDVKAATLQINKLLTFP
jgi:hypothetical protein